MLGELIVISQLVIFSYMNLRDIDEIDTKFIWPLEEQNSLSYPGKPKE